MRGGVRRVLWIIGLIVILVFSWYLFQDREPPSIRIVGRTCEDGRLLLKAEITDSSGVEEVYALVEYPSGKTVNITLSSRDNIYLLSLSLTEEGDYSIKIFARDSKGNLGSSSTTHPFYDTPRIGRISYILAPAQLNFNVTVKDTGGVTKVLVEVAGKNYTLIPLKVDSMGNGVYGGNIDIPPCRKISYKVFVLDRFGLSSSREGSIELTQRQLFLTWVKKEGYDVDLASHLFNLELVQDLFSENRLKILEKVLKIAQINGSDISKNLAYLSLDQIARDSRIDNKTMAVERIFDSYLKLGLKDLNIHQIYHVNNVSLVMGVDECILKVLKAIEKYGMTLDHFTNLPELKGFINERIASVHVNLMKIFKYNVTIRDEDVEIIAKRYRKVYPNINANNLMARILKSVAVMVERVVNTIGGREDDWKRGVKPAVEHGILFLRDGLGTEYGNLDYIGFQLLPPLLTTVDIKEGVEGAPSLEILKKNVNPDPDLGMSPDEHGFRRVTKDLGNPDSEAYKRCSHLMWFRPILNWPNSAEAWQGKGKYVTDPPKELMKEVFKKAPILPLGRGYAIYLDSLDQPEISEQDEPFYSAIVYRWLGIPATVVEARYPGVGGWHSEVAVWVNPELQKLIRDYGISHGYGEPVTPNLWQPYQWKNTLAKDYQRRGESLKDSKLGYVIGTYIDQFGYLTKKWYRINFEGSN